MPFKANSLLLAGMTGVMRRIIESGRQPVFDLEHWQKAKEFFDQHPTEDTVFLFPSGLALGEHRYTQVVRSRQTQVCMAQSQGWFPMVLNRHCIEFWEPVETAPCL